MNKENQKSKKKEFEGVIVSHYQNTSVVSVSRFVKHPRYGKYISISKKYKAHDDVSEREIGTKVIIRESRPISKHKRFIVVNK